MMNINAKPFDYILQRALDGKQDDETTDDLTNF